MDQALLNQLEGLARLNLSPESIRDLIAHDKWKTEENHRHEKEILLLSQPDANKSRRIEKKIEDEEFNQITSNGACGPEHRGLIAKTKVMKGASQEAIRILEEVDIDVPLPLLSLLIGISRCGERLDRWPRASDNKIAFNLFKDFKEAVEKFGPREVLGAVDFLSSHLEVWQPKLIDDQISELRDKKEEREKASIVQSPLFKELQKNYPSIEAESFEECYYRNKEQFSASAVAILRSQFKSDPPSELSHVNGWNQRWQQHLPHYLKIWQEDLKAIERKTKIAQSEWKESMYSQIQTSESM